MSGKWTIRAERLSKKFGLTLAQSMKFGLRDTLRGLVGKRVDTGILRSGEFWAVKDVDFEVKPGEALGIMGVNGSGKTTLLRILNGVYAPDRGRVTLRGRVGALIAAGAGFAPMLSGRENVYINGTLLGLSTREISSLMDEIVAFAELGPFIDLPVKNYSSGMFVRLGFAVAALSRPDVLLMDEVLAVGDLNFQKKCFDHILNLKRNGASIILVSHSAGAIWAVCGHGLMLDHGNVVLNGPVEEVIRAYDDQNARNSFESNQQFALASNRHANCVDKKFSSSQLPVNYGHAQGGTGEVFCHSIAIMKKTSHREVLELEFREPISIALDLEVFQDLELPLFRITIDAAHYRYIATVDSYEQGFQPYSVKAGRYIMHFHLKNQNFRPGAYKVNVAISRRNYGAHLFYWFGAGGFLIRHPRDKFLYADSNAVMHLDAEVLLEAFLPVLDVDNATVRPESA